MSLIKKGDTLDSPEITAFVLAHPWLLTVVIVLVFANPIFTILSEAAQKYVDSTVDTADNEVLVKVKASTWYRALSFILDLAISIKLPVKKKSVEVVK